MKKVISIITALTMILSASLSFAEGGINCEDIRETDLIPNEILEDVVRSAEKYFDDKSNSINVGIESVDPGGGGGGISFGGYSYVLSASARHVGQSKIVMIQGGLIAGSGTILAKLIPPIAFIFVGSGWIFDGYTFISLTPEDIIEGARYYNNISYYWTNEAELEFMIVHNEYCVLNGVIISDMTNVYYDDLRED